MRNTIARSDQTPPTHQINWGRRGCETYLQPEIAAEQRQFSFVRNFFTGPGFTNCPLDTRYCRVIAASMHATCDMLVTSVTRPDHFPRLVSPHDRRLVPCLQTVPSWLDHWEPLVCVMPWMVAGSKQVSAMFNPRLIAEMPLTKSTVAASSVHIVQKWIGPKQKIGLEGLTTPAWHVSWHKCLGGRRSGCPAMAASC